jgi:23S rRNA (cytidine1920-2'-O)/16S rRNA (cytidine1409-2'-O)-methyltransferase
MMAAAATLRLAVKGLTVSPAPGPAGNIEFLLWLQKGVAEAPAPVPGEWDTWLDQALAQAAALVRERADRRSSGEK